MVHTDQSKEQKEQKIFQLFTAAANLPIIPGSVKSEQPPAPDILCEIRGEGHVAFELVEIVTRALMQEKENGQRLRKALKDACNKHPVIAATFHNASIHVGFLDGITLQQRLKIVHEVVNLLLQHVEVTEGSIRVPDNLKKIVREVSVTRGVSKGPVFDVMEMVKCTDEVLEKIEGKCKKRYVSDHPIELLAYYTNDPAPDDFDWQLEFHGNATKVLVWSPFRRVWVYDSFENVVKYVDPPP